MAATVTALLTDVSSADTASAGGTWLGNSGAADTEVKIQGNGSYTWQASKNARTSCTFTPTTNLDMSGTGVHLYWWAQNAVASFMETKTTGTTNTSGYHIRLTDGSGNYKEWHIAGKDTWGGEWRCFVLDVNSTRDVYASSGTLDLSDIDVITWYVDITNSGNIRIIDNQWNDVVRFGTGLKITGTAWDLADVAADDENSSNRYGILETKDGVIFCQGQLQIGDGATTTTFTSADEVLVFKDRDANGSGIVASGFYKVLFTGSGLTADIDGLVCKSSGTTDTLRHIFDADDTNISFNMAGSTLVRAGAVSFAAGDSITNSVFNNCGQVDPSTSTFQNNTLSNYVGSEGGALLYPSDDTNIKNLTFLICDQGVEYGTGSDSTSPSFNNFQFDDEAGNYDVNNTSGGAVTIGVANTPVNGANSYTGSTVTFSNNVTLTVNVQDVDKDPIQDAQTSIHLLNSPYTALMNEDTTSGGVATESYAYPGSPVDIVIKVRKSATADNPRYFPFSATGQIDGNGFSLTVTLEENPFI